MWIKFAGKFATPEARRSWVEEFGRMYGGMNSGKTPVFENGMELQSLPSVSNADAQFMDSRKYADIDIAGLFRMPPHKLGILDRATWGTSSPTRMSTTPRASSARSMRCWTTPARSRWGSSSRLLR